MENDTHPLTFGQWVKNQRKAADLRQDDLAQMIPCSLVMIKKIEADQRRPSRQLAELLAQYLGIPAEEHERFLRLARLAEPGAFSTGALHPSPTLPAPLTPLIGRENAIRELSILLRQPEIRLLTLSGPGGVGKTRLLLQLASTLRDIYADGVRFVPLASIQDSEAVLPAIRQALDVRRIPGIPARDELIDFLRDKDLVLFLDNFEQVLAAGPGLVEILEAAQDLKVIVTSRSPLQVRGEYVYEVPPLALPDLNALPALPELANLPAVALFGQRARGANQSFAINRQNAAIIAEICVRLDGLPLAIELAASRCRALSPADVLAALQGVGHVSALDLLSGGAQDLPARHKTLRQTIEWSFHLLSPGEQSLFCQLGVFTGGFTLDAAEVVCGSGTKGENALAMMDGLLALIDHHMLKRVEKSEEPARFTMLELLREYALEQLSGLGWLTDLKRAHARFFLYWMENQAAAHLHSAEQVYWLERIEADHANLLAALTWCLEDPQSAELGLRLAGHLWEFWVDRGYISEGRAWLMRLLALPQAAEYPQLRAGLLNGAGLLTWLNGSAHDESAALLKESLRLFKRLGEPYGVAWVLNHLGQVEQSKGDLARARAFFEESRELFRSLERPWNLAWVLYNLSQIDMQSDTEDLRKAQHSLEEALVLFRQAGDTRGTVWTLYQFALLARKLGDSARATQLFQQCKTLFHESGDWRGYAWTSYNLGMIALIQREYLASYALLEESWRYLHHLHYAESSAWVEYYLARAAHARGDLPAAQEHFRGCLVGFLQQNERWGASWAMVGVAWTAAAAGKFEDAARWLAAARKLQQQYQDQPIEEGNAEYQAEAEAEVRSRLDSTTFAQAWKMGESMPEQAIPLL